MTGRWFVRLLTGTGVLRAELRLSARGTALTGSLVLESSDAAPAPLREGHAAAGGEFSFTVDAPEAMQFRGRVSGADLAGTVTLDRGRVWTWTAQRLDDDAEFYAALPRFRARQLVIGRNRTELPLPGAWVAAAAAEPPVAARAARLAEAAGLAPIPADSVRVYGFLPAQALVNRDALRPAMIGALGAIREAMPPGSQASFDALFRPRGVWVVDLHDASLHVARQRFRGLTWESATPALAAAGLLPGNLPPGTAAVPLALYRLATLRERDSAAYQAGRDRLSRGGQASRQAVEALVDGYRAAAPWQAQAVGLLLNSEWVSVPGGRRSPAMLVAAAWDRADLATPAIRATFFGYPEAVPSVGVPPDVIPRLVLPENWAGEQWMRHRGPAALLGILRRLDLEMGAQATLEAGGPSVLTTVMREAASTPAGFLEPDDAIVEDPGAPPLFALATAIHEWQHLLMERHRLSLREGGTLREDGAGLQFLPSDLFLAEGFAEWMSERILAPIVAQVPLAGLGDAWKLTVLEADDPADPHVLGLKMMTSLATALGSAERAAALVLADGDAPAEVAAAVEAWRDSGLPARQVPVRGQRRLVPETVFTVEDGVGDVSATVIRVPVAGGEAR